MKNKTYWIDVDVDGTPRCGNWIAKNKAQAEKDCRDYYESKGTPSRDIIIRDIK